MTDAPGPIASPERRTLRWLLGGQLVLAALLILLDLGPILPRIAAPSLAPELDRPTRPGDQTRRYRPWDPAHPGTGVDPDMPRRLIAEEVADEAGPTLSLRGAIAAGDGARIADALRRTRPATVLLDSPGGSVADAVQIGRAIRDVGAGTRLPDGAVCLSACPYVFAGGMTRRVGDAARLGVHQHSYGASTILPALLAVEDIQQGQAEVLDHLSAMGIDLRIMGPALATPADEIYILTPEELSEWNVTTAQL
ncbi:hypothetical protein MWU52_06650 [Jannaschia sp. S6380]|uniref:COG3904 family protein n=1 Tax=Jannaschia sp. S6380 TaxID=2926408 RepID=UPI001FF376A3|nr:hypothetical protein [Jannaschia sp. S6380]MCK0167224.1 hypothetical protein [Jannaschia sp. S6380]